MPTLYKNIACIAIELEKGVDYIPIEFFYGVKVNEKNSEALIKIHKDQVDGRLGEFVAVDPVTARVTDCADKASLDTILNPKEVTKEKK